MPVDLPIVLSIAVVALTVASIVARRAGEHADRLAGRRRVAGSARKGPLGAVGDLLDQSVAAYGLRRRLGLSTRNRSERRVADAQAAQVAAADEIRRHRTGAPPPTHPTHLVVAGHHPAGHHAAGHHLAGHHPEAPPIHASSTLRQEMIVAVIGFVLVVILVIAIAPRGTGDVLSATGIPGASTVPRPTPAASPDRLPEAVVR